MDKRTKNGQTNGQNYTNFERNLAMMVIYVPVKFEFDWTNATRLKFILLVLIVIEIQMRSLCNFIAKIENPNKMEDAKQNIH